MIELNCSYEKSKKILELGYDFGRVCNVFEVTNYTYHKIHKNLYSISTNEIYGRIVFVATFEGKLPEGAIPLIPEAALEKCLPEHEEDGTWYIWLGHTRCMTQSPDECDTSSLEYFLPNPDINSAYEAFLWLHENYPEELKKKFDEVMA